MKQNSGRKTRGCLGPLNKRNLLQFIQVSTNVPCNTLLQYYLDYTDKLIKNKGELEAAKDLKNLYNVALRHAAQVKYDPIPFLRSDKVGFPRVLKPFRNLLEGSPNTKRAALTCLQVYKLIEVKGDYSLSSITDPYTGSPNPDWLPTFDAELKRNFPPKSLAKRVKKLAGDSLHISGKNGPNGPATLSLLPDFESLIERDVESPKRITQSSLLTSIERLAAITGNVALVHVISEARAACSRTPVKHKKDRKPVTSRLRIKYEAGGKARVFCILDFFTQSALKPIHQFLMDWLKSQPQDGTNDHAVAAKQMQEWTKTGERVWSFDLTTATDRYPVFLQKRVMIAVFGQQIADLWEDIIVNREFVTPEGDSVVKFAVGQPLGALSSWAAFAVTHHIHIRTAAKLASVELSDGLYRIIGDDIGIYKEYRVALRYIAMMRDLAVPFSTTKSILPHQCKMGSAGELAKRVYLNGNEITPVPPDEILSGMNSPFGKRILIESSLGRGYDRFNSPYPVQSLLTNSKEYAAMTFPVGRPLSLMKGIKVCLSNWDINNEYNPPAGLNRGWAFWDLGNTQIPDDGFDSLVASFLRQSITSAIFEARSMLTSSRTDQHYRETKYQGGDWKPGLHEHLDLLTKIVTHFSSRLGKTLDLLDRMTYREDMDLYRLIAKVNTVPKIGDLLGRQKFMDEKQLTKLAANVLVKDAIKLRNSPNIEDYYKYICRYDEI